MNPQITDLSNPDMVLIYLQQQIHLPASLRSADSITPLTGGTANFTYRLHVPKEYQDNPKSHENETLINKSGKPVWTAILKHSASYIASIPSMPFDINRWTYEKSALLELQTLSFKSTQEEVRNTCIEIEVKLPEIYSTDDKLHVIIMEDAGINAVTLKELLKREDVDKQISLDIAEAIGTSLAKFLWKLHDWGKQMHDKSDVKRIDMFSNSTARSFCAWRTFGRLVETCGQYINDTEKTVEKTGPDSKKQADVENELISQEVLERIKNTMTLKIMTDSTTVTMGDFWTGNVLVKRHSNKDSSNAEDHQPSPETKRITLYIVDWEFIHPGNPSADVAQMMAELLCSERFAKSTEGKERAKKIGQAFLTEYETQAGQMVDRNEVMVQQGLHVVTWVGSAGWSDDRSEVEKVAREGLKMLGEGWTLMEGTNS